MVKDNIALISELTTNLNSENAAKIMHDAFPVTTIILLIWSHELYPLIC